MIIHDILKAVHVCLRPLTGRNSYKRHCLVPGMLTTTQFYQGRARIQAQGWWYKLASYSTSQLMLATAYMPQYDLTSKAKDLTYKTNSYTFWPILV